MPFPGKNETWNNMCVNPIKICRLDRQNATSTVLARGKIAKDNMTKS